ncbi:site-specific integrase [Bradyrhizobium sp. 18]|uniref:tyrosine-type recombinase/integrase n=1 Tax=Bradyrhizobium sp. 18 TaxID=2782657 RepID=UPI001FFAC778|nr:site-specific integrase [Bradyrhizobium sp. 18]MCK1507200.1 site-specific integrase [Bradyrhizobium sp. 18]
MSVYKHKDSPFYHYDFQLKGHRFHGSTGATNKREAEAFERARRDESKRQVNVARGPSADLEYICDRYWLEIGQHHAGADTTFRDLARLIDRFGKAKLLTEISDNDVAELVAWRRGHRVTRHGRGRRRQQLAPLIAPATVNRSTTEVLKKLFTRAKDWGLHFDREPDWRKHFLKEPEERVRELKAAELEKLDDTARDDYRPVMDFADASGVRLGECLLRWSEVDWDARQIVKVGKGDRKIIVRITPLLRNILWALQGHHEEFVFTYVAQRTRKEQGLVRGQRYPITYNGLKTEWKRQRARAGVEDFRFHDKRHDFATKLLRDSRNLKLVQKALNHRNIKTTLKYAHVLDDEIADAIEAMQEKREKSRKKSRTMPRKTA